MFVQDDVVVARAPGRLDVMGGIADYSGSLVLQVCYSPSPLVPLYLGRAFNLLISVSATHRIVEAEAFVRLFPF